jgi:hypothetical protein
MYIMNSANWIYFCSKQSYRSIKIENSKNARIAKIEIFLNNFQNLIGKKFPK